MKLWKFMIPGTAPIELKDGSTWKDVIALVYADTPDEARTFLKAYDKEVLTDEFSAEHWVDHVEPTEVDQSKKGVVCTGGWF